MVKNALSKSALRNNGVVKAAARVIKTNKRAERKGITMNFVGATPVSVGYAVAFAQRDGDGGREFAKKNPGT